MEIEDILTKPWQELGYHVVYQHNCLVPPHNNASWTVQFPKVEWTDQTIVVMHCHDFLTVNPDGLAAEVDAIADHFDDRAKQVVIVHWNRGLKTNTACHLIYFPTHSYSILHNLNQPPYDVWKDNFDQDRIHNWQCLNGQPRPHRRCVHEWLKTKPNGISSLYNIDPLPQDAYRKVYQWVPGDPFLNEQNFLRLTWLYATTKINIVTETHYSYRPNIVTEKTLFAMLAGQIPIVIGYPGIVSDCIDMGFDMFCDVVDVSYDWSDDSVRWKQALELNQDLIIDTPDLKKLQDRLIAQRHYVSVEWPEKLLADFKEQIFSAACYLANS